MELEVDGIVLKGNESGGRVGAETAYVLLQHWKSTAEARGWTKMPYWIQGGVGPNSAAACVVGGAAGVVLDDQLLLALRDEARHHVGLVLDVLPVHAHHVVPGHALLLR